MIWATVSFRSCFCWLYRTSPSSTAKNMINLISLSSSEKLKDSVLCTPWGGTRTLPKAALLFLGCSSLSLHRLLFLINNCLNLPFGTQERSRRLESVPCYQRWETQKEFRFQDPVLHWKVILRHCYSAAKDFHRDIAPRGRISNTMVPGCQGCGQLGIWGNRVKEALLLDL